MALCRSRRVCRMGFFLLVDRSNVYAVGPFHHRVIKFREIEKLVIHHSCDDSIEEPLVRRAHTYHTSHKVCYEERSWQYMVLMNGSLKAG